MPALERMLHNPLALVVPVLPVGTSAEGSAGRGVLGAGLAAEVAEDGNGVPKGPLAKMLPPALWTVTRPVPALTSTFAQLTAAVTINVAVSVSGDPMSPLRSVVMSTLPGNPPCVSTCVA